MICLCSIEITAMNIHAAKFWARTELALKSFVPLRQVAGLKDGIFDVSSFLHNWAPEHGWSRLHLSLVLWFWPWGSVLLARCAGHLLPAPLSFSFCEELCDSSHRLSTLDPVRVKSARTLVECVSPQGTPFTRATASWVCFPQSQALWQTSDVVISCLRTLLPVQQKYINAAFFILVYVHWDIRVSGYCKICLIVYLHTVVFDWVFQNIIK